MSPTSHSWRSYLLLYLPIAGTSFLSALFPFLEKILLGRFSTQSLEAIVGATTVLLIFQFSCISIAALTQVDIARYAGAGQTQRIGPCIWQMIWFSLLSMIITVPVSLLYGHYYFANTSLRDLALPYLHLMIATNFLLPLGAALSALFLGTRRGKELFKINLLVQTIGFFLSLVLIFGLPPLIPPLGLIGAGIAFIATQVLICLILLYKFFSLPPTFATTAWKFHPSLFWSYIRPGLVRSFMRSSVATAWSLIFLVILRKGEDFLLIFTVGGTLWPIFSIVANGMQQLLITEVSHTANSPYSLSNTLRQGLILSALIIVASAIPFLLFPKQLFYFCISTPLDFPQTIGLGLWLCLSFNIFFGVANAYILAFKDIFQLLVLGSITWILDLALPYLIFTYLPIAAPQLWLVLAFSIFLTAAINSLRARFLIRKVLSPKSPLDSIPIILD